MSTQEWWQAAFQAEYLDIYAHRDDASAQAEVLGVKTMLDHFPAGRVLDACCGNGRHLEALLEAGCDAYGFDWSIDLLRAAGQRQATAGRLFRADMRCVPTVQAQTQEQTQEEQWSAICLFFTAFGYFDDAGNAAVLDGLAQRLQSGGLLMLDLPPATLLESELPPDNTKEISGGLRVQEDRAIVGKRVEKNVIIYRDDKQLRAYTESVRIYDCEELTVIAEKSGLQVLEVWPSLRGPTEDDGRAVYWFTKTEHENG